MAKKEKTVVYVVDFKNKTLLLKEELTNTSSKKEQDRMQRINSAVECLRAELLSGAKAS